MQIDHIENTFGTILCEKGNIFIPLSPSPFFLLCKRDKWEQDRKYGCRNFLLLSSPTCIFVFSGILDEFKPATWRSVNSVVSLKLPGWFYLMDV